MAQLINIGGTRVIRGTDGPTPRDYVNKYKGQEKIEYAPEIKFLQDHMTEEEKKSLPVYSKLRATAIADKKKAELELSTLPTEGGTDNQVVRINQLSETITLLKSEIEGITRKMEAIHVSARLKKEQVAAEARAEKQATKKEKSKRTAENRMKRMASWDEGGAPKGAKGSGGKIAGYAGGKSKKSLQQRRKTLARGK